LITPGVELISTKWGGHPHSRGVAEHLGDDEYGSWFWGRSGRTIFQGDEVGRVAQQDTLLLIQPDAWWIPAWRIDHPTTPLYVNINTPAEWFDDRVTWIDLDLDVVRTSDGQTAVIDRDEFERHSATFGYPNDLITGAEAAASDVYERVVRNEPPFDGVAAFAWVARARFR
jgi:protein associated with RNAse G/E